MYKETSHRKAISIWQCIDRSHILIGAAGIFEFSTANTNFSEAIVQQIFVVKTCFMNLLCSQNWRGYSTETSCMLDDKKTVWTRLSDISQNHQIRLKVRSAYTFCCQYMVDNMQGRSLHEHPQHCHRSSNNCQKNTEEFPAKFILKCWIDDPAWFSQEVHSS